MFTKNFTKVNRPLEEAHTSNGHFYKHKKTGETFTSITTLFKILGDNSWIENFWIPSLMKKHDISHDEADKMRKKIGEGSMKVGTQLHKMAEDYLNGKEITLNKNDDWDYDPMKLFDVLRQWLDENVSEVNATECKIYSDDLKIAGTVDLVATLKDGKKYIIDFKNSRKPKMPNDIVKNHYYEQMCAYAKMWKHCTKETIRDGIVLVVSWGDDKKPPKVRPFKCKLKDYESDLWTWVIKNEEYKALNTT